MWLGEDFRYEHVILAVMLVFTAYCIERFISVTPACCLQLQLLNS